MSLEDRPPSHEKRYALTFDLLKLWREFIGEQYDCSEHPCSDYCTTRLDKINQGVDEAITRANGGRDWSGEEENSP